MAKKSTKAKKPEQKLNDHSKRRVGELGVKKGTTTEGVSIFSFDACDTCDPERCGLADRCQFAENSHKYEKCQIQYTYMKKVTEKLTSCLCLHEKGEDGEVVPVLPPDRALVLGTQLAPLYQVLIKLNMECTKHRDPVYYDDKGNMKVLPIYKTLTDVIRTIGSVWREAIQDDSNFRKMRGVRGELNDMLGEVIPPKGDGGYVDQM